LSHKNSENLLIKEKLAPITLKYSNSDQKPLQKIKQILEKNQATPPHIKKLEKFWEKIGKISEKNIESEGKDPNLNKSKKVKIFTISKNKFTGFPARFKEVSVEKSKKMAQETLSLSKGLKQDLFILKSNSKSELKYRIQIAKAARISEGNNGILKKKKVNKSWIWKTPEGTPPVDKSVKFDLDYSRD
jgi:alanyl-tRNA synthetase